MSKSKSDFVKVIGPIDPGKSGKAQFRTVIKNGTRVKVRIIDANSADFAGQFLSSFRSNVRKARKENRTLVDST